MKNDGVKNVQMPSEAFSRRLNNLIAKYSKQLTKAHFKGMTGPVNLEVNMTQGMINNAYLMPKRKLEIE